MSRLKRSFIVIGAIGICSALFGLVGVAYLIFADADLCDNDVISSIASPDRTRRVVVFRRDCGATTGWSTQVSLLVGDATLPNASGNLLVVNDVPVSASWVTASKLRLSLSSGGTIFHSVQRYSGVEIIRE